MLQGSADAAGSVLASFMCLHVHACSTCGAWEVVLPAWLSGVVRMCVVAGTCVHLFCCAARALVCCSFLQALHLQPARELAPTCYGKFSQYSAVTVCVGLAGIVIAVCSACLSCWVPQAAVLAAS